MASGLKAAPLKPQSFDERTRPLLPQTRTVTAFRKKVWSFANILSGQVGLRNESVRVRWIAEMLGRVAQGSRVLDAGCGEQQFRKFCSHLIYVGQDFAKYDGKG